MARVFFQAFKKSFMRSAVKGFNREYIQNYQIRSVDVLLDEESDNPHKNQELNYNNFRLNLSLQSYAIRRPVYRIVFLFIAVLKRSKLP